MGGRVHIRIHCRRRSDLVVLLTLALLTVVTLGILFLSGGRAGASPSGELQQLSVSWRRYYLTSSTVAANQVLTACATGYHMASLWEILDTTNLEYNSTLGLTLSDSGSGPPAAYYGWVRTGYLNASSTTPGTGNCFTWGSVSGSYSGTRVRLPANWAAAAVQSAPWEANAAACNSTDTRVWCVGDDIIAPEIYLPIVVKNY